MSTQNLSGKEPWLAVNLSMLFPGLGQIYSGRFIRGILIVFTQISFVCLGMWLAISSQGSLDIGILLLLISLTVFPLWNLFDSHKCARNANDEEFERLRKNQVDPWLAVFFTRFIPGLGHIYTGKLPTGVFLIFLAVTPYILSFLSSLNVSNTSKAFSSNDTALPLPSLFLGLLLSIVLIASGVTWILQPLVAYKAYLSAPMRRERSKKEIVRFCRLWVLLVVLFGLLALLIRNYVAEARYIPSGAMLQTLQINDRLIINKLDYSFQEPQRGDIIVFNPTETLEKQNFNDAFIQRIIGLPGETVELKFGKVYINGNLLQEQYINNQMTSTDVCPAGEPPFLSKLVTLPSNSYLVLGDNRQNSYDGRCWGVVPSDRIIGKATTRYWPFDRRGTLK